MTPTANCTPLGERDGRGRSGMMKNHHLQRTCLNSENSFDQTYLHELTVSKRINIDFRHYQAFYLIFEN